LKPDNILLDERNNALPGGFGIAKNIAVSAEASDGEFIVGSPTYLSPEQIQFQTITPATDIYSLGIMVYELLTGSTPFTGATVVELLGLHLHEPVFPVHSVRLDLPPSIDAVIQKATRKVPAERYQDAQTFAVGSASIQTSHRSKPKTAASWTSLQKKVIRHVRWLADPRW
jgi:serine/threonine-protein kinase